MFRERVINPDPIINQPCIPLGGLDFLERVCVRERDKPRSYHKPTKYPIRGVGFLGERVCVRERERAREGEREKEREIEKKREREREREREKKRRVCRFKREFPTKKKLSRKRKRGFIIALR